MIAITKAGNSGKYAVTRYGLLLTPTYGNDLPGVVTHMWSSYGNVTGRVGATVSVAQSRVGNHYAPIVEPANMTGVYPLPVLEWLYKYE